MNFDHIKKHAEFYGPVIALGRIISHSSRRFFERVFFYLTVFLAFLSLGYVMPVTDKVVGALMVSGAIWAIFFAVESFFYSYYFASEKDRLAKVDSHHPISFELSEVLYNADKRTITQSFLYSDIGREILARLDINEEDIDSFFTKRQSPLTSEMFSFEGVDLTLGVFVQNILKIDSEFDQFLMTHDITRGDMIGAANWVERIHKKKRLKERWWGIDSLARIKGVGKTWSYGTTFLLDQYGNNISEDYNLKDDLMSFDLYKDEIDDLEAVLAKNYEANALLVSDYGVPKIEVVAGLARRIFSGIVLGPLEHKRIVVLNTEVLATNNGSKADFERTLLSILVEAINAGNVILLISDLPAFVASGYAIGVDVVSVMDDYLAGNKLQVIAMSEKGGYEKILRPNEKVMTRFEPIQVRGANKIMLTRLLQDKVIKTEGQIKIKFTYQAINAMVQTVERYFMEGTLEDKVSDFLAEITPRMKQRRKKLVTEADIYEMVTEKTGVPVGDAGVDERQKLAGLEAILARRVVGQKEALRAISDAMRRNRSGIGNPARPVGSFLFLGPTGVGKTETSKALAEAVFGDVKQLLRLDMSEYNTSDSLNRLIGNAQGQPGVLTTLLREHPHGVLLLDEFEKTDPIVLNLFLQILDEGVFSDAQGKKVNARNMLFIATSNAGSDLIWNYVQEGKNLKDHERGIIDTIINRGVFKPELVNRFDDTILFSPLSEEELKKIAQLMLENLKRRVRDKGINFVINSSVIDMLVREGNDPQFGARPLNRAVQDKIEAVIAQKIISGELRPGSTYKWEG